MLVTIGHGKRSIGKMIDLLKNYDIAYVADVRSAPYSRYQPDFSHDALKRQLEAQGIGYLPMGEELGGRPDDPGCYDAQGRVDYDACRQRSEFKHGIERLRSAQEQGLRVLLLCSESKPENCHRSKLIGVALADQGIELVHLDEDDRLVSQAEVMERLSGGQLSFLPDPPVQAARSRRRYARGE